MRLIEEVVSGQIATTKHVASEMMRAGFRVSIWVRGHGSRPGKTRLAYRDVQSEGQDATQRARRRFRSRGRPRKSERELLGTWALSVCILSMLGESCAGGDFPQVPARVLA